MSEIRNYKPLLLGETERLFIILFSQRTFSAYGLWSQMKITKPMSYPNVFNKIQRLVELGLLEVEGKFKRKAIKYRLTTRGMFERLTLTGWNSYSVSFWYDYRENIVLQTLLGRFFEPRTIWKFREAGYLGLAMLISDYLRRCCEAILTKYKTEQDIEQIILNELRFLILKLVTISSIEEKYTPKGKLRPNINTYMTLTGDRMFFPYVREMKNDFDRGCKIFGLN